MKLTIIIINLLLFGFLSGQESYIVEYNYTFKKDSLSEKNNTEKYFFINSDNKQYFLSETDFHLLENEKKLETVYKGDGIIKGSNKNIKPPRLKSLLIDEQGKVTFFRNYFNKIKVKYDDKILLDWTLTNDTITHNGYLCNIATTIYSGRKYTAYFTSDILLPYGPYVFNGLPGLIIFISDTERNHIFELTKLSKEKSNYTMNNFKAVSKTDFKNMEYDYQTDPVRLLIPESNIINGEEQKEIKRKLKEKIKNDNNPIELKDE
ncbi:GLPGLI family protein [Chryseobacterium sp. T1]